MITISFPQNDSLIRENKAIKYIVYNIIGTSMNDHSMLRLENQLCLPLSITAKEIVRLYAPYLNTINLTYIQYTHPPAEKLRGKPQPF